MRNDGAQKKPNRGSSQTVQHVSQESDDWGVDWIQSPKEMHDEKPASRSARNKHAKYYIREVAGSK